MRQLRVRFLGTGTSHGIPVVGCGCAVCRSRSRHDKRLRSSIIVDDGTEVVLIDSATEFRIQAVRAGITRLSAIFYTHAHADHIHGFDDVRSLTRGRPIPVYANGRTLTELRERFSYIFRDTQLGGEKPRVDLRALESGSVTVGDLAVTAVPVLHGNLVIFGYRIGDFAYLTDVSSIPPESRELLRGLDTLVIGALRRRPHPTHFSIREALKEIEDLAPNRAFLTHLCHEVPHAELKKELPPGVAPAYDGLVFRV